MANVMITFSLFVKSDKTQKNPEMEMSDHTTGEGSFSLTSVWPAQKVMSKEGGVVENVLVPVHH